VSENDARGAGEGRTAAPGASSPGGTGGVVAPEVIRVPAPSWFRDGLVRVTVVALAVIVGLWLLGQLSGFLITLLLSIFLAFALEPPVNWLARHGVRRGAATLLTMALVFAAIGFFFFVIGALVVEQVTSISDDFPSYVDNVTNYVDDHFDVDISDQTDQLRDAGLSNISGIAGNAFGIVTTFIGIVFQLFTVVLFTYYFCARGPELRRSICSMFPPRQQAEVIRVWDLAVDRTAGFLFSRALLGLVSAVVHGIAFALLDLPYALTLAIWVGIVSQLIPTVGTYLAGALPILVALSDSPVTALWVLIVIVIYQQIENYLLTPPLSARTMEINPAVAFGAVIVGATIFGIPGAFLALPLTATATAFVGAYIKRHELIENSDPDAQEAVSEERSGEADESTPPA
jgi:predicted PurR-regulated permease PerM